MAPSTEADSAPRVLLTCAGRKSYAVDALMRSSSAVSVWAGDSDSDAPIRQRVGERFVQLPKVAEGRRYVEAIERIARENRIDAVVALNDMDVAILATHRERFVEFGVRILVPEREGVEICTDKLRFAAWLVEQGERTLPTWLLGQPSRSDGPFVIKDRRGQGSRGISYVNVLDGENAERVVQPHLEGAHYCADVVRSWSGESCAVLVKQKLESSAGTASMTVTVHRPDIVERCTALARALDARGPIDVDLIESSGEVFILEINPRLGGTFAHATLASPEFAGALVATAVGSEFAPIEPPKGQRVFTEWNPVLLPRS